LIFLNPLSSSCHVGSTCHCLLPFLFPFLLQPLVRPPARPPGASCRAAPAACCRAAPDQQLACGDTNGNKPSCNAKCDKRCPNQCIILCPGCKSFCSTPTESLLALISSSSLANRSIDHIQFNFFCATSTPACREATPASPAATATTSTSTARGTRTSASSPTPTCTSTPTSSASATRA